MHVPVLANPYNWIVQEDINLGRRLATGGFGTVYKAELKDGSGATIPVIVKKVVGSGGSVGGGEAIMRRL
jgi:hypothetical protein